MGIVLGVDKKHCSFLEKFAEYAPFATFVAKKIIFGSSTDELRILESRFLLDENNVIHVYLAFCDIFVELRDRDGH